MLIVAFIATPALGEKQSSMMERGQEIRGAVSNFGNYVTFTVDKTIEEIKERSINKNGQFRKTRSDKGVKKGSFKKNGLLRKNSR